MNDFLFRVGAVAMLVFGASSAVEAAPVTFTFEGEVVEIRKTGNPLFDLPVDIAIGRPASLELIFEPIPFPKAAQTIGTFIVPGGNISLRPLVRLSHSCSECDQVFQGFE